MAKRDPEVEEALANLRGILSLIRVDTDSFYFTLDWDFENIPRLIKYLSDAGFAHVRPCFFDESGRKVVLLIKNETVGTIDGLIKLLS